MGVHIDVRSEGRQSSSRERSRPKRAECEQLQHFMGLVVSRLFSLTVFPVEKPSKKQVGRSHI